VLELTCSGWVEVDGTVKANGEDATEKGTGGGAGGSIYITTPHFAGTLAQMLTRVAYFLLTYSSVATIIPKIFHHTGSLYVWL